MAKGIGNNYNSKTTIRSAKGILKDVPKGTVTRVKGGWSVKHGEAAYTGNDSLVITGNNKSHKENTGFANTGEVMVKAKDNAVRASDDAVYFIPVSEKIATIKKGISKKELETIKGQSDLDYDTLSSILSVSKAKLHSKKGSDKFDQNTSERIMLLADVVTYGQHIFQDKDAFNDWLKTNNKALGNKAPVELMDTMYGIDEVKKEIGRIEYGVF